MNLYDDPRSGNGYKVRLLLALLGRPYEYHPVDILKAETRTAEFLDKNPNGRIPLLELDDGTCLPESNAILYYLARDTDYWPRERLAQAQVQQWLFFEQYSHEPNVTTPRFWLTIRGLERTPFNLELLAQKQAAGNAALAVMDGHLATRDYFVGGRYSIADIALYAYTHEAHEGGFDLARYPAVVAWLARVSARPGHITMDQWTACTTR